MHVIPTPLAGLVLLEPTLHVDERGSFREAFRADQYASLGLPAAFPQDNVVVSKPGVLRGLHMQHPEGQDKLITVLAGAIYDVCVDLRVGSPTFGRCYGERLTADNPRQLFVPRGFAHGYCVVEAPSVVAYKCSAVYAPAHEFVLAWNDPELKILWPLASPQLSEKDRRGMRLRDIPRERLPRYAETQPITLKAFPPTRAA